jgi:F-type H+-transporting ATPase subunit b
MDIINLPQIIWQAINFLILYFVIAKFIVPPTKKFLAAREHEINQGLENAQIAKKQLDDAEKLKNDVLVQARSDGNKILEEVRVRAEQVAQKVEADSRHNAKIEADRIIEQSKEEIELYKRKLEEDAVRLAGLIAEKSVGQNITVNLHHDLLTKQLEQLKAEQLQQA